MSDQQIENAAKAMYEDDVANTPQDGLQPPWNHLAVEWKAMYSRRARAAAPILRADLEAEVARLTERVQELGAANTVLAKSLDAKIPRARLNRRKGHCQNCGWPVALNEELCEKCCDAQQEAP